MLVGAYTQPVTRPQLSEFPTSSRSSFLPVPWDIALKHPKPPKTVAVIGGGLAGCLTAYQLAQRGIAVTLLEKNTKLADAASGNLQGILYAKLSMDDDPLAQYNLKSLQYAQHFYSRYFKQVGNDCGVLQLSKNEKMAKLHAQLAERYGNQFIQWLQPDVASQIAGQPLTEPALYFPQAGWINPPILCRTLTEHPLISRVFNAHIDTLEASKQYQHDRKWIARNKNGEMLATADAVVIANAVDALHFPQTQHLPLKSIRGQVTHLPATQGSNTLNAVVCADGYVAPAHNGLHTLGATFNLNCYDNNLRPKDHTHNLQNLKAISPELADLWRAADPNTLAGRVGYRCTTTDYLPVVGPAPIENAFDQDYALLRHNAQANISKPGQYWPGLYVNTGFGSRGLTYAPLASEYLASLIAGEPLPISADLARSLHPGRFIIRQLIRNQR